MQEENGKSKINSLIIFLRVVFLLYLFYRYFHLEYKQFKFYPIIFLSLWYIIIILFHKLQISRKKITTVIISIDSILVFLFLIKFGLFDAILSLTFPILELSFKPASQRLVITIITFLTMTLFQGYQNRFDFIFLKLREFHFGIFYLFVLIGWSYSIELYLRQLTQSKMLLNLIEIGQRLTKALTHEKIFEIFSNIIKNIFQYSGFAMYIVEDNESPMLKLCAVDIPHIQTLSDCSIELQNSVLTLSIKERRAILVEDLLQIEEVVIPKDKHLRSIAVIPINFEERVLGVFFIAHSSPGFLKDEDLKILSILANQSAVCLRNVELHKNVSILAITDSLSGLYTQGYFLEQLNNFIIRAKHEKKQLSVIILDVDFFKQVNDTYGHPQGDLLLRQMSGLIKEETRGVSLAARYGGDEFCVILFDTDKTSGVVTAERIRTAIEQYEFVLRGKTVRITISGGVATYPEDAITRKELIQKADDFLYKAKQSGRNRICVG